MGINREYSKDLVGFRKTLSMDSFRRDVKKFQSVVVSLDNTADIVMCNSQLSCDRYLEFCDCPRRRDTHVVNVADHFRLQIHFLHADHYILHNTPHEYVLGRSLNNLKKYYP